MMACFLRAHIDDADFAARFAALQAMKREQSVDVNDAVAAIIADVCARGDAALIELTEKFDRQTLSAETCAFLTARSMPRLTRSARKQKPHCNWRLTALVISMPAKNPRMTALPMPAASSSAIVGQPSMRPVFMCRVGWPITRLRC
jgi:hypothetical protein